MVKIGIWKIQPLKNQIILTLIKYKGEMLDTDLLRNLQKDYTDLTKNGLSKLLFDLEVENIIAVQKMRKNTNKIALLKTAPIADELLKELRELKR